MKTLIILFQQNKFNTPVLRLQWKSYTIISMFYFPTIVMPPPPWVAFIYKSNYFINLHIRHPSVDVN